MSSTSAPVARRLEDGALMWAAIGLGLAALSLRPVGVTWLAVPVLAGGVALAVEPPIRNPTLRRPSTWAVIGLGLAGVVTATVVVEAPPAMGGPLAVAGSLAAAVGEEAFFRRLLYGRLARWGAVVAVLGAAVAFTVVHLPAYGWAAAPVNLGAGILFGWQRWATGGWGAPALTHGVANLMAMGWTW